MEISLPPPPPCVRLYPHGNARSHGSTMNPSRDIARYTSACLVFLSMAFACFKATGLNLKPSPSNGPSSGGNAIVFDGVYFKNGTTQILFDGVPATDVQARYFENGYFDPPSY